MSLKGSETAHQYAFLRKEKEEWKEEVTRKYGGPEHTPEQDGFDFYLCRRIKNAEEENNAQSKLIKKRTKERNLTLALCAIFLSSTLFLAFSPVPLLRDEAAYPRSTVAAQSVPTGREQYYIASVNSNKYHLPSCDYADNILEENRIYYATAQDAENAGKTPCSVCRP